VFGPKNVIPLPQHGNANGGKDQGLNNVGIIFGARVYGNSLLLGEEMTSCDSIPGSISGAGRD